MRDSNVRLDESSSSDDSSRSNYSSSEEGSVSPKRNEIWKVQWLTCTGRRRED